MTQATETAPIVVEQLQIEGDTDLYGLITVTGGNVAIEFQYELDDLVALGRQISQIASAIVWHRAEWLYTMSYGRTHLARKADRKILCGSNREFSDWHFTPLQSSIVIFHDLCKRCQRIYEKATTEQK